MINDIIYNLRHMVGYYYERMIQESISIEQMETEMVYYKRDLEFLNKMIEEFTCKHQDQKGSMCRKCYKVITPGAT